VAACEDAWRPLPKSFSGCGFASAQVALLSSSCARAVIEASGIAAPVAAKTPVCSSAARPTAGTSKARKDGWTIAIANAGTGIDGAKRA
jgi:hypothetical protein